MATGLTKFTPYSEFRSAFISPIRQHTTKTPQEVETEMLAVVAQYERQVMQ